MHLLYKQLVQYLLVAARSTHAHMNTGSTVATSQYLHLSHIFFLDYQKNPPLCVGNVTHQLAD
jgi:hypothetical protein